MHVGEVPESLSSIAALTVTVVALEGGRIVAVIALEANSLPVVGIRVEVVGRVVADLVRRRDSTSLRGLLEAWQMRGRAVAARATSSSARTDQQILADSQTDLRDLLRL